MKPLLKCLELWWKDDVSRHSNDGGHRVMLRHRLWVQSETKRECLIDMKLAGLLDLLRFGGEIYARLSQAEQRPRL